MDKKISQLTSAASLTGTEVLPIVQNGQTVNTTVQDVVDLAGVPYKIYTTRILTDMSGVITQTILENTLFDGPLVFSAPDQFGNIIANFPVGSIARTDFRKVFFNLIATDNVGKFNSGISNVLQPGDIAEGIYVYRVNEQSTSWSSLSGVIEIKVYPNAIVN